MRYTLLGFTVALVIAIFATTAPCKDEPSSMQEKDPHRSLYEDFWYDWYDDLGICLVRHMERHFYLAKVNFRKNNMAESADELRRAAANVKLEARRAKGEQYKALKDAFRELRKLADDVEGGKVTSSNELEEVFARAHYASARHHFRESSESWKNKDARNTGHALEAAATHLKHAATWAHQKEEELVAKVVKEAHLVAEKLTEAGDWASEEVDKVLAAFEKMIEPEKE